MKTLLKDLEMALVENTVLMEGERRLALQCELMMVRVEIMKSIIKVQGEMLAERNKDYKEAA